MRSLSAALLMFEDYYLDARSELLSNSHSSSFCPMENVQIASHLDSDSGFNYSDLPDPANPIRLLRGLRAEEGQTVHCDLSVWPTESVPSYNAISYTWGDPASIATIILNGKQIIVRHNCEYVLRQAYWNGSN